MPGQFRSGLIVWTRVGSGERVGPTSPLAPAPTMRRSSSGSLMPRCSRDADLAGDEAMAAHDAPVRAGLEQLRHHAADGIGMRAVAREIAANRQVDRATALWVLCRYRHKTHWTRHPSRLDRDFGRKRYGDEGYAIEELVAELGSAFLSADLDLTPEVRDDHAAYIASWIKALKDDKRAIFSAASHAQRAADFLHGLQNPAAEANAA
jgi:hypothetical protein